MALTVRPDDEVYQFDTVWLGPDEYTLPIQARYVAWGTWLACFLVAAVVLVPIGGDGPGAVFGSLIWALGLSVVLSRAVMLVVDHERPLRSLPALFSSEARAALQARRRAERALLVRPAKIRVREIPPKVVAIRERQRGRAAAKADRTRAPEQVPVDVAVAEPDWTPDAIEYAEPVPAWSVPRGHGYESDPVPVTYGAAHPAPPHLPEPVATPARYQPAVARHQADAPGTTPNGAGRNGAGPNGATPNGTTPNGAIPNGTTPNGTTPNGTTPGGAGARPFGGGTGRHSAPDPVVPVVAAAVRPRPNPFRTDPHHPDDQPAPYRGPVTVSPTDGRLTPGRDEAPDGQAAIEARILLPARKDR